MEAPAIRLEHKQQQTLTPRMQQAVRLLQISSLDFALELQETAEKNPFLEIEENEEVPPFAAAAANGEAPYETPTVSPDPTTAPATSESESRSEEESWGAAVPGSANTGKGDGNLDMLDFAEAHIALREYLRNQLGLMQLSERDHYLACVVAEAVDDDGYLRMSIDELRASAELSPEPDDDEMQAAIRRVQSLEPTGVGARDVRECLLLQIESSIDGDRDRDLARRVVADHLDLLARHDHKGLAAALGSDVKTITHVCEQIRRLAPHPGFAYGSGNVQYLVPDVIVKKRRDKWEVALNTAVVPKVRLNRLYAELFQSHRESHHGDLANHLQEARWAVRNVEQRFMTILRVAQAIVEKQKAFFEFGPLAMRPMGLREIAEMLELHESTVSRVTNNKYMATPMGVFELKYFFSRALETTHGQARSATSVRSSIKQMIEEEHPDKPLSDAEIARLLARRGLKVARRTVTKYRQLMHIPAVGMRRAV